MRDSRVAASSNRAGRAIVWKSSLLVERRAPWFGATSRKPDYTAFYLARSRRPPSRRSARRSRSEKTRPQKPSVANMIWLVGLAEGTCGAFLKPVLPLRDLVRMHIKLLRKLSQSLVALESGQSHLRLKCCCVVPARSSAHLLSSFRHFRRLGNRAST